MIKLADILIEVTAPKPEDAYPLTGPSTETNGTLQIHKYSFKNRKGDDMTVAANFDTRDDIMYVVFYKSSQEEEPTEDDIYYDDSKYKEETGSGDMLKVLATVVEAVRRTAKRIGGMQKIMRIQIEPADKRRFNIYVHYAKTLFPEFSVREVGSWIWLNNKNYKREA